MPCKEAVLYISVPELPHIQVGSICTALAALQSKIGHCHRIIGLQYKSTVFVLAQSSAYSLTRIVELHRFEL